MEKELIGIKKLAQSQTLSEQVADVMVDEIEKGTFKPGERLPAEMTLADKFGVSRTVIREALARLKYDGLLESRQGSGGTVAETGHKRAFRFKGLEDANDKDIGHLYELRAALEGYTATLAAMRRSTEDLVNLQHCLEEMSQALETEGEGALPDALFHQRIARASGNPYLMTFMQFLDEKLQYTIKQARDHTRLYPGLPQLVQKEHEAILQAIVAGDPRMARKAAQAHVRQAARRLGFSVMDADAPP
jgi:GntR family transcriptional repressor for pyruvate dehydrogenase complex